MVRSKNSIICLIVLAATGIVAPWLAPNLPNETHPDMIAAWPTLQFPFGTDALGRCVLSRILYGSRTSLIIGLSVLMLTVTAGGAAGLIGGFFKGRVGGAIEFVTDMFLALPSLILALSIYGVIGAGVPGLIVALAASSWMRYARVIRGVVLSTSSLTFVEAAAAAGASRAYIGRRHLLPHAIPAIAALAPVTAAHAILNASALSFLGLGVPPPTAEWGSMLSLARPYMRVAPHLVIVPGLALTLLIATLHWAGKFKEETNSL